MNKKKLILVLGSLAAVSFALTLVLAMMTAPAPPPPPPEVADGDQDSTEPAMAGLLGMENLKPKELQLDELIREVRQRIVDVQARERAIDEREKRFEMAHEELRKQAQEIETLRLQLTAPLNNLLEAQAALDRSRLVIAALEKDNLKHNANVFEKMPDTECAKVIERMCANGQQEDVVKTLRYMSERGAAKAMAALTDKDLAASIFEHMKRIREEG